MALPGPLDALPTINGFNPTEGFGSESSGFFLLLGHLDWDISLRLTPQERKTLHFSSNVRPQRDMNNSL